MPEEVLETEAGDSSLRPIDALEGAFGQAPEASTFSPSAVPARTFAARSGCWRSGWASCSRPPSRARVSSGRSGRSAGLGCWGSPSWSGCATRSPPGSASAQAELGRRGEIEAHNRGLVEAMIAEPQRYRWVRVSNEDVGEPGCRHWHSRPRWGILGMLLGWWRVKLSSGCPLARGPRPLQAGRMSKKRRKRRPRRAAAKAPAAEPAEAKAPATRPRRAPALDERPPAPWGSFPLVELVVLVAIVMLLGGFVDPGRAGGRDDRSGARARRPRRPRAVGSRALRRLPLTHAGAVGCARGGRAGCARLPHRGLGLAPAGARGRARCLRARRLGRLPGPSGAVRGRPSSCAERALASRRLRAFLSAGALPWPRARRPAPCAGAP